MAATAAATIASLTSDEFIMTAIKAQAQLSQKFTNAKAQTKSKSWKKPIWIWCHAPVCSQHHQIDIFQTTFVVRHELSQEF